MSKESYESNQAAIQNNIADRFSSHEAAIVTEFGQPMYDALLSNGLKPGDVIKIVRHLEQ